MKTILELEDNTKLNIMKSKEFLDDIMISS